MSRSTILCALALALMMLSGCSVIQQYSPFPQRVASTPPSSGSGVVHDGQPQASVDYGTRGTRPYTVSGHTYYPLASASGYDQVGTASWYGRDFHGRLTASGDVYDMYGISAAHKTLPLGTRVRVTNLENNRAVTLIINDRGPFVGDRLIDLSYGAANMLGMADQGLARVRITALMDDQPANTGTMVARAPAASSPSGYAVQVGTFSVAENARMAQHRLTQSGYSASIQRTVRDGRELHVVRAGSFASRDEAQRALQRLSRDFPGCFITS